MTKFRAWYSTLNKIEKHLIREKRQWEKDIKLMQEFLNWYIVFQWRDFVKLSNGKWVAIHKDIINRII